MAGNLLAAYLLRSCRGQPRILLEMFFRNFNRYAYGFSLD